MNPNVNSLIAVFLALALGFCGGRKWERMFWERELVKLNEQATRIKIKLLSKIKEKGCDETK